jgi:predicted HicB family RNase H-like nuclease
MTLTLHLDFRTEKILRREAKAQGKSMEALAESAVEEAANRMDFDRPVHEREKR